MLIKASSAQMFFSGDCTLTLEFKYFLDLRHDDLNDLSSCHVFSLLCCNVPKKREGFTIIKKKYNNQALVKLFFLLFDYIYFIEYQ